MTIKFDIPAHVEALFAAEGDPNRSAMEAALVDLYRRGRLGHAGLAAALGISRYDTDGVLKRHGVLLPTKPDEALADARAILGQVGA